MKILLADDEPIARQVLREHLEEIPGMEIAGEASNGVEAAGLIARFRPDVALLDVQMPGLDGFALARSLEGAGRPLVIFVTAHATHAVDAFHVGAIDYLLKPVRRERLERALQKAGRQLQAEVRPAKTEPPRRIVGRRGTDFHVLDPGDVVAFLAEGEVVHIVSSQGRFFAGQTLRALEDRLPSPPFRRIHRKTIINTNHIRKISPLSSKRWLLTLTGGLEAVVSKRMAGIIRSETDW